MCIHIYYTLGVRLKTETGIPVETINAWSLDPAVKGKSLFDTLEDKDASDCIAEIKKLLK